MVPPSSLPGDAPVARTRADWRPERSTRRVSTRSSGGKRRCGRCKARRNVSWSLAPPLAPAWRGPGFSPVRRQCLVGDHAGPPAGCPPRALGHRKCVDRSRLKDEPRTAVSVVGSVAADPHDANSSWRADEWQACACCNVGTCAALEQARARAQGGRRRQRRSSRWIEIRRPADAAQSSHKRRFVGSAQATALGPARGLPASVMVVKPSQPWCRGGVGSALPRLSAHSDVLTEQPPALKPWQVCPRWTCARGPSSGTPWGS